jgi:hypothetical protein
VPDPPVAYLYIGERKTRMERREQIEIFYLQSECDFYAATISVSLQKAALSLFPISKSVYVIFAPPATFLFRLHTFCAEGDTDATL